MQSPCVPLTVFELCTAILWAQGLHLNDEWEKTRQKLTIGQILRMQGGLEGTMFLQVINLLATLTRKLESTTDERIAVSCRREDLLNLKAETVRQWWDIVAVAYRDASKFMESQGVISQRLLPYSTLLVPLAAIMGYLKHTGGNARFGQAWPKIEQWYWCSVFSQRYSSAVEAASGVDFEQVVKWIDGGDVPEAVRTFGFAADRLHECTSIRSAIYKGLLCLLAKNGAKDFGGEGTLSINLYYDSQQDHHHIFPINALSNLGIKDVRADSIINKTLIGASMNRSIGGRRPSVYIETMKSRLGDERAESILRSHLISPETLTSDDWEDFVLSRREELKQLIHVTCGGQMQSFSDGKRVPPSMQVTLLSENVNDIEMGLRDLIALTVGDDWKMIPDHERIKADERIETDIRANPGIDRAPLKSVRGRLAYCDLRGLEQIIVSKSLWPRFSDVFGTKESISGRFRQISALRNANAHLRDVDEVMRTDAEAAVIWFNAAMSRIENDRIDPVDLPIEDTETVETSAFASLSSEAFE